MLTTGLCLWRKSYLLGISPSANWASSERQLAYKPTLEEWHSFFVYRAWSLCRMNFFWLLGTASSHFTWILAVTKAPLPPWHQMENVILRKLKSENLSKVKTLQYVPDYWKTFIGSSYSKSTCKICTLFSSIKKKKKMHFYHLSHTLFIEGFCFIKSHIVLYLID